MSVNLINSQLWINEFSSVARYIAISPLKKIYKQLLILLYELEN